MANKYQSRLFKIILEVLDINSPNLLRQNKMIREFKSMISKFHILESKFGTRTFIQDVVSDESELKLKSNSLQTKRIEKVLARVELTDLNQPDAKRQERALQRMRSKIGKTKIVDDKSGSTLRVIDIREN